MLALQSSNSINLVCLSAWRQSWRDVNGQMTGPKFEILLAEDNPADVGLVREALKEHDVACVLHVVGDGEQAITLLEGLDADSDELRLDLVLLDMHLPKHDGEDILKHLRSTERYAHTPVLVVTGSDSTLIEEKSVRDAALSYFRKPSTLEEFMQLGAVVRSLLAAGKDHENRGVSPADAEIVGGAE
jgi:CheY-like chemotaxis protein